MDSLGKLFDWIIFLTVLFFIPVNWAISSTGRIAGDSLSMTAEEFLDDAGEKKMLDSFSFECLDDRISILKGGYRGEVSVKRNITENESFSGHYQVDTFTSIIGQADIEVIIEEEKFFRLNDNDLLILRIFDREALYYAGMRRIG